MSKGLPKNVLHLGFELKLDATGTEAKWQKVFPLGETRHRDDFGTLTFDRAFLTSMLANYATEGKPERPWDYFHRGMSDDSEVRNEDKVAAGWFSDMQLRDDGLYVLTRWTDKARAAIAADELRYPSPTFVTDATDPKTGAACGPKLLAVALLNDPFLTDLPPVEASAHPKGTPMKLALATLVSAAKLNADTTEENLEKALKAQADDLELTKAKLADRDGELVTLKAKADDDAKKGGAAGDVIKKLAERVDAQAAELKKLTDERATDAVTALQAKLESEGRILAAEKPMVAELIKNLGLTKATEFCATLPVKVDLKERGTNKPGPASGMDPVEAHKQLQLKAAELAKEKPVEAAHAYELACRANPDLAKAAAKLTSMKPDELDQVSPLTA